LEQPPVRLYVAGLVTASLVIFTGTFSYGLAVRSHRMEKATASATPAPAEVKPAPRPVAPAASRDGSAAQAQKAAAPAQEGATQAGPAPGSPGPETARRHAVKQGDTVWELAAEYGVDLEELLAANKGLDPGLLQIGQELVIPPRSKAATTQLPAAKDVDVSAFAGKFSWPVLAPISSYFGSRWGKVHEGIDLAANMGDPIKASRDGQVLIAGTVPGYGYTVVLQHPDGTRTLYAHASQLKVRSSQKVHQGDVIALVGSTGHSTGPHLHFEIIINNRQQDPLIYLPKR
jgi:murein DD-endopeptidase MepM/ murein hydrolase activator NlpD